MDPRVFWGIWFVLMVLVIGCAGFAWESSTDAQDDCAERCAPYAPVVKGAPATGFVCYCDDDLSVPPR